MARLSRVICLFPTVLRFFYMPCQFGVFLLVTNSLGTTIRLKCSHRKVKPGEFSLRLPQGEDTCCSRMRISSLYLTIYHFLNKFYPFVFDDNKPFLIKSAYRFFVCFLAHPEQAVDNFRRAFIGYKNKSARCF